MDAPLSFHGAPADSGRCSIPTPPNSGAQGPALTITEAEEFFTSGDQAWPEGRDSGPIPPAPARVYLKNSTHSCCQGVDVPGVGHAHAPDCQEATVTVVIDAAVLRNVSQETRQLIAKIDAALGPLDALRDRRNGLLGQLVFAPRELAEQSVIGQLRGHAEASQSGEAWCRECQMTEHLGRLLHAESCKTGRVLRVLAELCALPSDGICSRGLTDLVCLKCGERGGQGWSWAPSVGEVDLSLLGLNQAVKKSTHGTPVIYTHDCACQKEGGAL